MSRWRSHLQFVRVPGWGFDWPTDATYYGRRWAFQFGPWLVFFWQLTDEQIEGRMAASEQP